MRQLLVSNGTAVAYTNGVLASGAIDIQIEDPAGPVSLSAGQTISDSNKIRFVQGTPEGKNIFSPWIDGKNISVWKGESYSAQVAQVSRIAISAVNFVAAGEATVKLVELNNGQAQFKRKSYVIAISAGQTPTQFCTALAAAINADLPDFIDSITNNGTSIDFTGKTFSLTLGTELSNFKIVDEGIDGSNGPVATITYNNPPTNVVPSLGYGSAEVLSQYEKSLQGDRSFYNRIMQPNTPPSYIDTATPTTYDVYSLVAENGSVGQIKGVDNVRSITIAYKVSGTGQAAFEGKINPWLNSCSGSFTAVQL